MRYILTVVEQLDRAARELSTDHPINNRLALILIDNATELILHHQCMDYLNGHFILRNLQPKQWSMARGKYLEGKLKVLEYLGDITGTERKFIKIAHHYRNELYHIGLKHDDITRPISGNYFLLCCDLFVRLEPSRRSMWSTDTYTDVAKRYLPICNGQVDLLSIENEVLAEKLRNALPDGIPDLAETLADSARRSVEEIKDAFEFSVQENPSNLGTEEVLRHAQWQLDFTKALECKSVNGLCIDPSYQDNVIQVRKDLEATWRQRYTSLPSEKWKLRADAVEREADPLIAMELYQSLRNDMSYLEDAISAIAAELDEWIQIEIDRARGK